MDLTRSDPVELARTVDALTESLDDRRTPAEVRAHAKQGMAIVVVALVMGVVGVIFDGWWPWAPLVVIGAVGILPVTRMLRTGNAPSHGVDPARLARQVLEAPWPEGEGPAAPLDLRARIQEVKDRLGVDDEGRLGFRQKLAPRGYSALALATVGVGVWAAVAKGEPLFLLPMALMAGALGLVVRYMLRRNALILEADTLLEGVLERLTPPA